MLRGTLINDSLELHAQHRPESVAMAARVGDSWQTTSWGQLLQLVDRVALGFSSLGVAPSDRIAILAGNRPEWAISALAAMKIGAVPAGIYQTSSADQVSFILNHSKAALIVAEGPDQLEKLDGAIDSSESLRWIVGLDAAGDSRASMQWQELLEKGDLEDREQLDNRSQNVAPEDLGTLIYTSGTTGRPKAVMLTHRNIVETCRIARELHRVDEHHRTVSYLPLAHVAEQMISIHMAVATGYATYFASDPKQLPAVLLEVEPTIFFGVPRVWEKLHAAIRAKVAESNWLRQRLFELATTYPNRLTDRLLASKVRGALGLGKVELCCSGAAPIGLELLRFFDALGLRILEVWGLSESSGPATWNYAEKYRFGTIGAAMPEVDVRVADDGEILVRGPNVFAGYLDDPVATEAVLVDGWLHTGDLGTCDQDGFFSITGRKKELIITAGGKNIAPVAIEELLKRSDLVAQAIAIGDRRKFLSALIVIDSEVVSAEGLDQQAVDREIAACVASTNEKLSRVEQIRSYRCVEPFTAENGCLTPTLKLRRSVILERHASLIETIYDHSDEKSEAAS